MRENSRTRICAKLNFILDQLLRQNFTQTNNGLFPNNSSEIPTNMQSPINGTYNTETIGWHHDVDTAALLLLAPAFVALLSITIVLATLYRRRTSTQVQGQNDFDASDILHVISAAAAGGLQGNYDHLTDPQYTDVFVRWGKVESTGKLGLVESTRNY